jgi:outer membrane protein assembly factor BamB
VSWSFEDGGPRRTQLATGGLRLEDGDVLDMTSRLAPACTMVVAPAPGELFLLRHSAGDGAFSLVERIDPCTLEPLAQSAELTGGPVWPGGLGAHPNGSLYVVFGNHAHRLDAELNVVATRTLPRELPYNSFVVLPDGHLVTKDFAGSRPGVPIAAGDRRASELVVLEPDGLEIVATLELPEPSIARLSADGSDIYVVGDTSLLRVTWDGHLALDDAFTARYRTLDGQTYGWDCVIAAGAAWFLDNGDGSENYSGTLRGHGQSTSPLHLVRVELAGGEVAMAEICGRPGGLVANPPVVDERRGIAVGYDSGNGVLVAFGIDDLEVRWQRDQNHASHLVLFSETGELVTNDHDASRSADQIVVVDIESGRELSRADTGSPVQSVLFPCPGFDRDVYLCSFTTVSRVTVRSDWVG